MLLYILIVASLNITLVDMPDPASSRRYTLSGVTIFLDCVDTDAERSGSAAQHSS